MKKLIFTLVGVCALGLSSFASTTTISDQFPPGNWLVPKYPYQIEVWKKVPYTNPQQLQLLKKETGCQTDSFVNNRIIQLKNQYGPDAMVGNMILVSTSEPRVPCNDVIVYPFPGDVILDPIKVKP